MLSVGHLHLNKLLDVLGNTLIRFVAERNRYHSRVYILNMKLFLQTVPWQNRHICLPSNWPLLFNISVLFLPSLKLECDKLASEKSEMQRHYIMVSVTLTLVQWDLAVDLYLISRNIPAKVT